MKQYTSNAKWPPFTLLGSDDISQDYHYTKREAECVCKMLEENGFGGNKKVFPLKVWVDEDCEQEYQGWCQTSEPCKDKILHRDGVSACSRAL
jgi:hypothetical protein